jgi:hypothetical protein
MISREKGEITMTPSIFSQKSESFLRDELCICLDDLANKILTDAPQETKFFKDMLDYYLTIKFPYDMNSNLNEFEIEENSIVFESELTSFYDGNELEDDSKASPIDEELYHVLRSYSKKGLSGVWYYREASLWYPKIIITKNFGSRDIVDSLDDIVTIYRGTSQEEFESNKFGQAWSLKKNIANKFAFTHYKESDNYKDTLRVVIQAQISKYDIYHYREYPEGEVVINPTKLIAGSIQLVECKMLTVN